MRPGTALSLIHISSSFGTLGALGSTATTSDVDYLTSDAVGVIDIDGTIQYDGTTCSPEGLKAQLDVAAENKHIKACLLYTSRCV